MKLFPNRDNTDPYDFGAPNHAEFKVMEIVSHRWKQGRELEFEVVWDIGDVTWETLDNCCGRVVQPTRCHPPLDLFHCCPSLYYIDTDYL